MTKVVKKVPFIGEPAAKILGGGGGGGPAQAVMPSVTEKRATQVKEAETREAMLMAQARAGGAERTENEADLLDYTRPAKRKTASRQLLG